MSGALAAAAILHVQAGVLITSVVETNGDNEATDTIVAQWTGETFVSGVAGEPIAGSAADDAYTVGFFQNGAPAFVDRSHAYADDPGNSLPIPIYLIDGEYIMSGNDNRDNDTYVLDVTVSRDVICYMLIDNRTGGDNSNTTPPEIGPGTGTMEWIDGTWTPVIRAGNRRGDLSQPDEVGFDESADGDIDQWLSVYSKAFSAGTFQLFQANNPGRNMYGVVVKEPPTAPVMGPVVGTAANFVTYLQDQGGLAVLTASIEVQLDGEVVTTSNVKAGDRTDITYDLLAAGKTLLPGGTDHTVTVNASDDGGNDYTFERAFTVGPYLTVPADYAVASATGAGMNIDVYQTAQAPSPGQNSIATTEHWWARGFTEGGVPWEDQKLDWWPQFADGITTVNWVASHELYGGDIGPTPAGGPDNFNSALPASGPIANDLLPGIPGMLASYDNYVVEVFTYLQLDAGYYRMGVNSDDGFKVSVAQGQPGPLGMMLGQFDGGRGASDTTFDFAVTKSGYYPIRLLQWQGGGDASCEWFTVNLETGEKTLVNGAGASVKAYMDATGRARVSRVLPADGYLGSEQQPTIRIELEDGSTQVDGASIKLSVAGIEVTPTVTKSGTTTTVTYTPDAPLPSGFTDVTFVAQDTGTPPLALDFNSRVFSPWLPLDKPPYQQTEDGMVVIDAEYYHESIARSNHAWEFLTAVPDYSAEGYMQALPDGVGGTTSNYPGFLEQNPELIYQVNFVKTGLHYLWLRGQATSGTDDSVHAGLDGDSTESSQRIDGMGGYNPRDVWVWVPGVNATNPDTRDNRATLTIPGAGDHTVHIWQREDGFKIDKLILTTDVNFVPIGMGPDSSRFVGEAPPPSVQITAPADFAKLPAGDVTITVDASDTNGTVTKVEYFANDESIGESTVAPFSFTWSNPPAGRYVLQAVVTDNDNDSGVSGRVNIQTGTPPPLALFVVADAAGVNASDAAIADRLAAFGFDVSTISDEVSTTEHAAFADLIVVSSTVGSGNVADKFRDVALPFITWEQAIQDDMLMTLNEADVDRGGLADQTELIITNAGHPLAAGLAAGTRTVSTAPDTFSWGEPNAATAIVIATLADGSGHPCIYAYDQGAMLIDGTTPAAGKRILLPLSDSAYEVLNADGLALVDAAIGWASGRSVGADPKFDPPVLNGSTLTITWTGSGTLQEATVLSQWTDVTPQPAGNSHSVDVTAAVAKFYRLR